MKTLIGQADHEPEDATAVYRRKYKSVMTDVITAVRNSGRLTGRK